MDRTAVTPPNPIDLAAAEILSWRQGDVFTLGRYPLVMLARTAAAESEERFAADLAPESIVVADRDTGGLVALVAQTCDVVRPPDRRPDTLVAPVVRLEGNELREASAGTRPRYARLPEVDANAFADLDHIFPVEKLALIGRRRCQGVGNPDDSRALSTAIARSLGRFAFPDEFVHAVARLTRRLREKYGRESPEGEVLRTHVEEILVESDWEEPPWNPTIIVVLREGVIASNEGIPEPDPSVLRDTGNIPDVCGRLVAHGTTLEDKSYLWLRLGELWADLLDPSEIVGDITIESIPENELPYSRARRCNALDLDYLSAA